MCASFCIKHLYLFTFPFVCCRLIGLTLHSADVAIVYCYFRLFFSASCRRSTAILWDAVPHNKERRSQCDLVRVGSTRGAWVRKWKWFHMGQRLVNVYVLQCNEKDKNGINTVTSWKVYFTLNTASKIVP